MITRRNIRVKVMQLLYCIDSTNDTTAFKNPVHTLDKNFSKTRELLTFLLYNIIAVAKYAEIASLHRSSKYVPTEEDLNVNTKISGNQILWQIVEDASFQVACEEFKTKLVTDQAIVKKLYEQLVETDKYKKYIHQQSRERNDEIEMLSYIFNELMLQHDWFVSSTEDKFSNWDDDAEMLQIIINKYLPRPQSISMQSLLDGDKWNFAKTLLTTCLDKKEYLMGLISPKLKNWDADRIASLDMAILLMGVSELLYFETIPTKVTINEYIDLAKEYSTPQSGQFVNGILDNLHKELLENGKINKIAYKKALN
jgi:transcription antitermination protein NusB